MDALVSIRPSAPLAPALFTTMTGWPISLCLAMMPWMERAIWSEAPPALNGTTISTGLVGSQANAGAANETLRAIPSSEARAAARAGERNVMVCLLWCEPCALMAHRRYGRAVPEDRAARLFLLHRW
ncbi:hypothetical protein D3C81_1193320 [compost metagenome]